MTPMASMRRNEIAKLMALGAGGIQPQQPSLAPMMPSAPTPMAAPQAVPYSEAGFGYGAEKLTPLEELGMMVAPKVRR